MHEVLDLAAVDAHHAQQQVAGHAQRQRHRRVHDTLHGASNVGGEDLRSAQLLVAPVRRQPYFAQRALLGQNNLRVKHAECERS
mmetsp:Transcript_26536/g.48139  ORF Transcript_26536/g.48139 Transcript_26536/m.48139 type:complete len:84 (-) Transcript_26536:222-473(-)